MEVASAAGPPHMSGVIIVTHGRVGVARHVTGTTAELPAGRLLPSRATWTQARGVLAVQHQLLQLQSCVTLWRPRCSRGPAIDIQQTAALGPPQLARALLVSLLISRDACSP